MGSNAKVLSFTIFEHPSMVVVSFHYDIVTAYHMINMAALTLPLCTTLKTWSVSQMSRVHVSALKIFFICRLYSLAFINTQMSANSKHIFLLVNGKSKNIVKAILWTFFFCALFDYFILSIIIVAQHWYSRDWSPNSSTSHYQTPWKLLFLAI